MAKRKFYGCAIVILLLLWALIFIYRSSFIAMDGKRYFCLFDDAMTSMTYARNLVAGNGLTWNGTVVEGYTNLFWVLIMAFVIFLCGHIHAPLIIQLLGIVILAANACVIMKIMVRIYGNLEEYKVWIFAGSFLYYPLLYWTLLGLEIGLLCLLLSSALYSAISHKQKVDYPLILSCFLLVLTRPDMALPVLIVLIYRAVHLGARHRHIIAAELILLSVSLLLVFLFKYEYYGHFLPNTYYLKVTGIPLVDKIRNGIGYSLPCLVSLSFLALLRTPLQSIIKSNVKSLIAILFVTGLLYQVYVGGDAWPPLYRMTTPVFIILLVMVAVELFIEYKDTKLQFFMPFFWIALFNLPFTKEIFFIPYRFKIVITPLLLLFFLFVAAITLLYKKNQRLWIILLLFFIVAFNISLKKHDLFLTSFNRFWNSVNVNRSLVINEITSDNASIAVFWAGTMPYMTGRKSYDFLGKNDEHIARLRPRRSPAWAGLMKYLPGHNKYDLQYTLNFNPTMVEELDYEEDDLLHLKEHYYEVHYQGARLFYLQKNSENLKWDKIRQFAVDGTIIDIDDYHKLRS